MGFDLLGKKPSTEEGKYFRNNIAWWCPLAEYVCEVAPDITSHCTHWFSNDGDGLNAKRAIALADRPDVEVKEGHCERYKQERLVALEKAPDEPCFSCNGSGTRQPINCEAGDIATAIKCSQCDGKGMMRPLGSDYPFDVENVQEFITFLRGCGGFRIY
jgi:hypothetical protein